MRIRLFEPNKPKEKVPLLVVRVDSSNSHYLFFYSFYADKIYKYPQKEKRSFRFVTDGSEEYPLSAMDKAVFKTIDSISRPRRAQALKGNQITGFVEEH